MKHVHEVMRSARVLSRCGHDTNMPAMTDLGQSVFQGYTFRAKESNRKATARPDRPWGSTQIVILWHNRAQHFCPGGRVTGAAARGVAHAPAVVPREGMIRLFREKGLNTKRISIRSYEANSMQPKTRLSRSAA